jgi:hypothetical protein
LLVSSHGGTKIDTPGKLATVLVFYPEVNGQCPSLFVLAVGVCV